MAEVDDNRILKLEREVAALSQQLAEVTQQLATMRAGGFRSIRDSRRCPACGSGALLHVRRAKEVGLKGATDFSIAHHYSTFWGTTSPRGALEAFACRHCGIVEWHVIDLAEIPVDGTDIVSIDPEPEPPKSGPFR